MCPSCGGQTPGAFAFCQHCGAKVGILTTAEVAVADTLAATDGEEIVPLVKKRSSDPGAPPQPQSYVELSPEPEGDEHADASVDLSAHRVYARLITVLRDGTDGEIYLLADDLVDVGRSEGQLLFADDAFLAARHVRFERRAGAVVLLPLDTTNGVYVRVRQGETVSLRHGDQLLLGKEVLRFEVLEPEERAQLPAIQHGVRLFGSPMRSPWARLMQMVQLGVARDVYHLVPPEVVLGREEGDVRFPDDEFMSRRHARIANRDGKFELSDEGSSNGTYIRLRGERLLRAGDRLRLGDQLFRYEPVT
jgi:pSer/pThr/pTyr-binding forkhead associated (FHA) protein